MTTQEYKDLAVANGYTIGTKTDLELLADYDFHKKACTGFEEEVFTSVKDVQRGQAVVSYHRAYRVRFMIALDGLDMGEPLEDVWRNVLKGAIRKSRTLDKDGNLDLSKL